MLTKLAICGALRSWINQRPGLDFANYGEVSAYRSELRSITRTKRDALALLQFVEGRDAITAQQLAEAFPRAFSGRLTLKDVDGKAELDYCTGQYWPTEYRNAAAAVCASVLWDYMRANMPAADGPRLTRTHGTFTTEHDNINGMTPGDWLRREAKNLFGASIQRRWFS